jgi:hypothetical protein
MPAQQLFSYIMIRTSYFQWSDEEVRFVLELHGDLNLYSDSSLKQQSADKHVAPSETFSWFRANQPFYLMLDA